MIIIINNYNHPYHQVYNQSTSNMKNPFSYSSLSSYCNDKISSDKQSLECSRALSDLQVSRHIYLAYNPLSPTSKLTIYNQFQARFSSPSAIPTLKKSKIQNPFLYAKPFRFTKDQPIKDKQIKGLSKWEKNKYLQQYLLQNLIQNKDQILKTNNAQIEKRIKTRDQEPKKSMKIQNRSQQYNPKDTITSSKGLKKALNFQAQALNSESKDEYSFSHDIQSNPYKQQISYPPINERILQESQQIKGFSLKKQSRANVQMQQQHKDNEDEQSKSIIHRLHNENEAKSQAEIISSKVQAYNGKKENSLQQNDSNYKREVLQKVKQVDSNLYIDSNKNVIFNPLSHEQYPRQITFKHERYELVNIL